MRSGILLCGVLALGCSTAFVACASSDVVVDDGSGDSATGTGGAPVGAGKGHGGKGGATTGTGGASSPGGSSASPAAMGPGAGGTNSFGVGGAGGKSLGLGAGGAGGAAGGAHVVCSTGGPDLGNDDQTGCTCVPPKTRDCYTGDPAKAGVGICKHGTQLCSTMGSGEIVAMKWSSCMGDVPPGVETCGDGIDNDCNGQVDEGCCTGPIDCTTPDGLPGSAGCVKGVQQPCMASPCTTAPECDDPSCCDKQLCIDMGKSCCTGPTGCTTGDGTPGVVDCVNGVAQPCKALMTSTCPDPSDCGNPACCFSPICAQQGAACNPGGCPVGQVLDPAAHICRACDVSDCSLVPALCCAAWACVGTTWCSAYICGDIGASCNGVTSSCNQGDLDEDDSFGDCDEAFDDPCCPCKVAVGCGFGSTSICGYGEVVKNNQCAVCTPGDCSLPPCMGLNGCPTNCPPNQFFNGAWCEACFPFLSGNIPACH